MTVRTREFLATDTSHIDRIALGVEKCGSKPDLSIIAKAFVSNQILVAANPLYCFDFKTFPAIGAIGFT